MGRFGLAVRAFFGVLSGSVAQDSMRALISGEPLLPGPAPGEPTRKETSGEQAVRTDGTSPVSDRSAARDRHAEPPRARRSEAITLLATLQREARFVDLVQEPLQQYTDQQIGAAARDVLRDCRQVLSRLFDLQPIAADQESSVVETPGDLGQGRWHVTGKVQGEPPFQGRLVHHGWEAARCDLPQWSGSSTAARVIAPAEVEC